MQVVVTRLNKVSFGKTVAFADIDLTYTESNGNTFTVTVPGVTVVNGEKGLFTGLPQKKGKDEKYYNVLDVDKTTFFAIKDAVLAAYNDPSFANKPRKKKDQGESGGRPNNLPTEGSSTPDDDIPF